VFISLPPRIVEGALEAGVEILFVAERENEFEHGGEIRHAYGRMARVEFHVPDFKMKGPKGCRHRTLAMKYRRALYYGIYPISRGGRRFS
jgi:hypothetical protein